jgi:pseudouridine synthase
MKQRVRSNVPRRQRQQRADSRTPETTQKLQKVLAQAGLGSRREMELWIASGKITVNGTKAALGARVSGEDRIELEGRPIRVRSEKGGPRVLLYHKPEGEIVSRDDPRGRASVFERLPPIRGAKWIAVGRLDFNTGGLLVFTSSGDLANRMMHPRFELEREYAVRVMGRIEPPHIQRLLEGIELEDGLAQCISVEIRARRAEGRPQPHRATLVCGFGAYGQPPHACAFRAGHPAAAREARAMAGARCGRSTGAARLGRARVTCFAGSSCA